MELIVDRFDPDAEAMDDVGDLTKQPVAQLVHLVKNSRDKSNRQKYQERNDEAVDDKDAGGTIGDVLVEPVHERIKEIGDQDGNAEDAKDIGKIIDDHDGKAGKDDAQKSDDEFALDDQQLAGAALGRSIYVLRVLRALRHCLISPFCLALLQYVRDHCILLFHLQK